MVEVSMQDTIKMLIELQELDSVIFDRKRLLEEIPDKIKEFDRMLQEKSANLKTMEEELKKLQVNHKEKEGDLKAKEEAIKKHQAQLYQVKTNQEYAALEKEIGYASSDAAVEKWAYENHMARPGDYPVVAIDPKQSVPEPTFAPQPTPVEMENWQRWLSLFVDFKSQESP